MGVTGAVAVYVHVPYCLSKCRYCDFNSYPVRDTGHQGYVDAVLKEMKRYAAQGLVARSLYVGGGTPTILPVAALERLVAEAAEVFSLDPAAEVTVEANPGTIDAPKLEALRRAGVNRLSIGLQACQDELLKRLGRPHGCRQFLDSFETARDRGFKNINVDIMFGIPGQRLRDWAETLSRTVSLRPDHISAYNLKVEEGTPLADEIRDGTLSLPAEAEQLEMWDMADTVLEGTGYRRYEISNYSLPGMECSHNLVYWRNEPYLGIGAGACSYLCGRRFCNPKDPAAYVSGIEASEFRAEEVEEPDMRQQMTETVILGLRLAEGMDLLAFKQRFGVDLESAFPGAVDRLERSSLAEVCGNRLRLTSQGVRLANRAMLEFV